jgi:hypothetical protein
MAKKTVNFLILGNDNSLEPLDVERIEQSKLVVLGINRSYLIYPNSEHLFIQDPDIVIEMFRMQYSDDMISEFNIISTPYFFKRVEIMQSNRKKHKLRKSDAARLYRMAAEGIISTTKKGTKTTKSIPSSIQIFSNTFYPRIDCTFYLLACGLNHNPKKNHFWSGSSKAYNPGKTVSNMRQLNAQFIEFLYLRKSLPDRVKIISCTANSRLNKMFPYVPLEKVLCEL